jgi:hypothetical protein|tara:strand:+ start:171 stop:959 length:789 start_codon:yes stop_codon:yes gene_type:complete
MKQIITGLFLTVSLFLNAQIVNITYVTVPRENSETFLELHEKFVNLSNSKERTITQSAIFAHAFAGDYTFAIYDSYNNMQDLVNDTALANDAMKKNVDAMELDAVAKDLLMGEYRNYSGMYAYNHSDQIRQDIGLEKLQFSIEDMDWSTKKVVVVSTYEVKWGMNQVFQEGIINGSLKEIKETGHAEAHFASQHLYGSGADFQTYQVFNSWSDFAAYEEANLGGSMSDDDKKFWSSIEGHSDQILTLIGAMNKETKVFSYKK